MSYTIKKIKWKSTGTKNSHVYDIEYASILGYFLCVDPIGENVFKWRIQYLGDIIVGSEAPSMEQAMESCEQAWNKLIADTLLERV